MPQQAGFVKRIDIDRLRRTMETLGSIGRDSTCGITRYAFSREDLAARELLVQMFTEAGLTVRVDAAGNIFGRREGRDSKLPALLTGSHIDTVPTGGMFDGALGVLAALECIATLEDLSIETRHPIEVVSFSDEEGVRFQKGLLGSKAFMGQPLEAFREAVDIWGTPFDDVLEQAGFDSSRLAEARRQPGTVLAFIELHVEQGQVLELAGAQVGIVEGIVGIGRLRITFKGTANHAGTTPMALRKDALLCASELVLKVEVIATEQGAGVVGTVGSLRVNPGVANIVPGLVTLTVEFRALDQEVLQRCLRGALAAARAIAERRDVEMLHEVLVRTEPVRMDERIRATLEDSASHVGASSLTMPSGAGHDAMVIAQGIPTAMLFAPSRNGISHSPAEWTEWEHAAMATEVLLEAVIRMAS